MLLELGEVTALNRGDHQRRACSDQLVEIRAKRFRTTPDASREGGALVRGGGGPGLLAIERVPPTLQLGNFRRDPDIPVGDRSRDCDNARRFTGRHLV